MNYGLICFNLCFLFIICPITEWGLHYFLHLAKNNRHNIHHERYRDNMVTPEKSPIIIALLAYYYGYYYIVFGALRYWIIHTLIHFAPEFVPILTHHHLTHHKFAKYNFGVSSIYPDKLFGTLYQK